MISDHKDLKERIKTKWHAWLEKNIAKGLTRVYAKPNGVLPTIDISRKDKQKFIIFSDQHRGARNGADDFQRSERAYNAALAYYNELDYTLIALGDVEELWEERPDSVFKSYPHSLELEKKFHKDGRYIRVFGNHDDIWQQTKKVEKYLQPKFDNLTLTVRESLKILVQSGGQPIGEFFLTHGHQGSLESDYLTKFSRFLVRNLWRPFQRLTKIRLNTPAHDWKLRKTTNIAMHNWAKQKNNLVLITGHTHYPVFKSKTHEDKLVEEIAAVRQDKSLTPDDKQAEIAVLSAKFEWVRATQGDCSLGTGTKSAPACYFNSGCCCYADGDITGLEIADGHIRLVRWSSEGNDGQPKELDFAPLAELFPAPQSTMAHSPAENGARVSPVPLSR